MLEGEFHEGVTAVDVELLADVSAVMIDGATADEQLPADLDRLVQSSG